MNTPHTHPELLTKDEQLALEITKAIFILNPADSIAEKTKLFTETYLEVFENVKKTKYKEPKIRN